MDVVILVFLEIIKMLCGSVQHEEDIPAPLDENEETSTTSYVVQPSTTHNVATTTTGIDNYRSLTRKGGGGLLQYSAFFYSFLKIFEEE